MCNIYTESTLDLNSCQTVSDAACLYASIPRLGPVSQRAAFCILRLPPHALRFTSYRFAVTSHLPENCTYFD